MNQALASVEPLQSEWNEFVARQEEICQQLQRHKDELRSIESSTKVCNWRREILIWQGRLEEAWAVRDVIAAARQFYVESRHCKEVGVLLEIRSKRIADNIALFEALPTMPPSLITQLRLELMLAKASRDVIESQFQQAEKDRVRLLQNIDLFHRCIKEAKGPVKALITECKQAAHHLKLEVQTWVTVTRQNLEWYLEHGDGQNETMLSLYKERHPNEDLSAITGEIVVSEQPSEVIGASPAWRFIYLIKPGHPKSFKIHLNREKAIVQLHEHLVRDRLQVSAEAILEELDKVAAMTIQDRQRLKQISAVFPIGWKILQIGIKYRALLNINEGARTIEFHIGHRKDVYK